MNDKEMKEAISGVWPHTRPLSESEFVLARDLWTARQLLSECLEMADNWPAVAYSDDLSKRVTEFLSSQAAADYLGKLFDV